ncbi:MAG TPA: hypothetical protein VI818_05595 [Candidatus Thermoplasmatota archaeon]|nr:hypothetical protein [Candidatus Thermoplasmatota archaeon]
MVQRRLVGWLDRHRAKWLVAIGALVLLYTWWAAGQFDSSYGIPYQWMLWLIPAAWLVGLAFSAALETLRPIHPDPELERTFARGLHALLLFPLSLLLSFFVSLLLVPITGGISFDFTTGFGVNLFVGTLLGPVILGSLTTAWLILRRRGTLANRIWFAALAALGTVIPLWISRGSFGFISGEVGSGGLPFLAAALTIALVRFWRAAPVRPDEAAIELAEPQAPTFQRARF